jgi:CheY-like chemotaxis protein
MDDVAKLLTAMLSWAWFALAGFTLIRLYPTIAKIFASRSFTLKIAGQELTVQDTAAQFSAQIADLQNQVIELRKLVPPAEVVEMPTASRVSASILWVDDVPTNIAWEIEQLQQRGIAVAQVASTAEAINYVGRQSDLKLIISDMGRVENDRFRPEAGLDLLRELRSAGVMLPFFVYTTAATAAARAAQVKAAGGDGATASTVELVEWVKEKLTESLL